MSLIELRDLTVTYNIEGRPLVVLDSVNLSIDRGEMIAILGPSGSGKSTLLYVLGCLLKPTSGEYIFEGHRISSLSSDKLADLRGNKIGFIFQQFHLLSRANLLENILLANRYAGAALIDGETAKARAVSLLKSVGLNERLDHKPNQLSGGQQQRLAIARALLNQPSLVLADEPTGNLDSKSSEQVLDLLQKIHEQGHTVVIITHDSNVAKRCQRVVTIKDGKISEPSGLTKTDNFLIDPPSALKSATRTTAFSDHFRTALTNLLRNKARSILTMLGVIIGIAAVLSTLTLGSFTRKKILETYENLGVNKLVVRAYPNWRMKATDVKGIKFDGISEQNDIGPMRRLFPEILMVSPVMQDYGIKSVEYGGRSFDQPQLLGTWPQYLTISNRSVVAGQAFSNYHLRNHSRVCLVGYDIAKKLFGQRSPLHQILQIDGEDKQYSCLVIGVLSSQTSNNEWFKPNQQILVPNSFLSLMTNKWYAKPRELDLQVASGASFEDLTTKIRQFFNLKYGRSAEVHVDSNQLLVAQMKRFLTLFTMLLAGVALISLSVGGIGITNMMLISVSERYKEIGLRKALGARNQEIRLQFLIESVVLCGVAGLIGLLVGVVGYHSVLYFASKFSDKIHFEWIFNLPVILFSVICILAVGLCSGLVPAVRAEKLEVIEALRSE